MLRRYLREKLRSNRNLEAEIFPARMCRMFEINHTTSTECMKSAVDKHTKLTLVASLITVLASLATPSSNARSSASNAA